MEDISICPVCGERRAYNCKCPRSDSTCENGHNWHLCTVHKKIVIGRANHKKPSTECTCK